MFWKAKFTAPAHSERGMRECCDTVHSRLYQSFIMTFGSPWVFGRNISLYLDDRPSFGRGAIPVPKPNLVQSKMKVGG